MFYGFFYYNEEGIVMYDDPVIIFESNIVAKKGSIILHKKLTYAVERVTSRCIGIKEITITDAAKEKISTIPTCPFCDSKVNAQSACDEVSCTTCGAVYTIEALSLWRVSAIQPPNVTEV